MRRKQSICKIISVTIAILLLASSMPTVVANGTGDKTVLWDLTHGVFTGPNSNYHLDGDYSNLVNMLTSMGYTVETTDIGVNNVNLNKYDVLVICVVSSWHSQYTDAEVDAIKDFVDNGGGLLIMGDNVLTPNENIASVANLFETRLGVSDIGYFTTGEIVSHPINSNVNQIRFYAPGEISCTDSSHYIAYYTGKPLIAALDSQKVVITGDVNIFDNRNMDIADNRQLAENIFNWLSGQSQSTTIPEFPTIALPIIAVIGLAFFFQRRRD